MEYGLKSSSDLLNSTFFDIYVSFFSFVQIREENIFVYSSGGHPRKKNDNENCNAQGKTSNLRCAFILI